MAPMGLNNWLLLDEGDGPPGCAIAFRWGEVCEQQYRLGETVWWPDGARPDQAAGEHLVPGLGNGAPGDDDRRGFLPVYYLVRIIDDLIVAVEPVDEQRFAEAEAILVARGIPQ